MALILHYTTLNIAVVGTLIITSLIRFKTKLILNKGAVMKYLILLSLMASMFFSLSLSQSSAEVTLIVGDGSALPGSTGSPVVVSLDNLSDVIKGIQVDVCDVDDFLSCTTCDTTERTTDFTCSTNERPNGCCRIVLVSLGGDFIEEGTGPVFTISYDVLAEAPSGNCIELNPEGIEIADETGAPLTDDVVWVSGQFCFPTTSSTTTNGNNGCLSEEIYGENSEEVELLRYSRDNVLSQTPVGQEIIKLYYQWGPVIVKAMEKDEEFKEKVKELIDGVMGLITEEAE
jgi:hypothetical protein